MKVKLLKKIRKDYTVLYNPTGIYLFDKKLLSKYFVYRNSNECASSVKESLQECKDWILEDVKFQYKKYSRKVKSTENKVIKWT